MSRPQSRVKPKERSARPPRTDWGDVAPWYDQLVGDSGSEYHREVVIPGVLRMLALQTSESVLDVACGQGVLCRALHERGAEVTGIDAAQPLIEAAMQRGPNSIHYQVGDAQDLGFLPARRFDAAVCVLSIQNIHPLPSVFSAIARVVKPAGRLVVAMMHPCFRGAKETSWGWDGSANVQYRRVDRYLVPRKTPIQIHPGSNPDQYTWTFHRPISQYVKALRQAGFLIDALEEWPSHKNSTSGPRAPAENIARKEIPMFMALRALNLPAATVDAPAEE